MKVSYKWLQTYFKDQLPTPETLVDLFTFHSFEIEGVEKVGDDVAIDAKILPDRAHYALSHRGIAAEISALTALTRTPEQKPAVTISKNTRPLSITVEDTSFCPRYSGRVIENVQVTESPAWLAARLKTVGSRSINSIVDATNYVMLDTGQPLHAFDADKVQGSLSVRPAKAGEKITTLDDKEVTLTPSDFVIADEAGPLAIAGVKGGKRAEVTVHTHNIIIESANFDASRIRKTSTRVGIRNDSSKRFENAITPELTSRGMDEVTSLILKLCPDAHIGELVDKYPTHAKEQKISITATFINTSLGVSLEESLIIELLEKQNIHVVHDEKTPALLHLTIPYERLDLTLPFDIIEEVGRLYGYDRISPVLPKKSSVEVKHNKEFYYIEKIKDYLVKAGLSEVYLYALTKDGEHEVAYPLAKDKAFLRTNLTSGIEKALELNLQNAPLLALQKIKLFEIGNVFTKEGEHTSLSIGIKYARKIKGESANEELRTLRDNLLLELTSSATTLCTIDDTGGLITQKGQTIGEINRLDGIMEVNLTELIKELAEPKVYDITSSTLGDVRFKPLSVYPFIARDIAVFVPETVQENDLRALIVPIAEASGILQKIYLFDEFKKTNADGSVKKSYGFRLIFQSYEKTLEDTEVNAIMERVYEAMKKHTFEVR